MLYDCLQCYSFNKIVVYLPVAMPCHLESCDEITLTEMSLCENCDVHLVIMRVQKYKTDVDLMSNFKFSKEL